MMKPREFAKYLARDLHCVCGCVGKEDTLIPQHRANRGMGGCKELDTPSNIVVMCSEMNGRIEDNADAARNARIFGWKLKSWQIPTETPFYDIATQQWFLIDNDFNRVLADPARVEVA